VRAGAGVNDGLRGDVRAGAGGDHGLRGTGSTSAWVPRDAPVRKSAWRVTCVSGRATYNEKLQYLQPVFK